jgi:hypothetical protein
LTSGGWWILNTFYLSLGAWDPNHIWEGYHYTLTEYFCEEKIHIKICQKKYFFGMALPGKIVVLL